MIPENDKKEVVEALTIGLSADGMIHIYTRLDMQDVLDLLEDAFDIILDEVTEEGYTKH
jgi:hypothetical protein